MKSADAPCVTNNQCPLLPTASIPPGTLQYLNDQNIRVPTEEKDRAIHHMIRQHWQHLKSCPTTAPLLYGLFGSKLTSDDIHKRTPALLQLWDDVKETVERTHDWEATLANEALQWSHLSEKFVGLAKQTLLGVVKDLPLEFSTHDLAAYQKKLEERRLECGRRRDDLVRRLQALNKRQQCNEEFRTLLLHLNGRELNAKLLEATETLNLIGRHCYVVKSINSERQSRMNLTYTLRDRSDHAVVERMKRLSLNLPCVDKSYLVQDDFPTISLSHANDFDTNAVSKEILKDLMRRERDPNVPPVVPSTSAEGLSEDFVTGGFWLPRDVYRQSPEERSKHFLERKWRLHVGEPPR